MASDHVTVCSRVPNSVAECIAQTVQTIPGRGTVVLLFGKTVLSCMLVLAFSVCCRQQTRKRVN